jgi:hypothetical protein
LEVSAYCIVCCLIFGKRSKMSLKKNSKTKFFQLPGYILKYCSTEVLPGTEDVLQTGEQIPV